APDPIPDPEPGALRPNLLDRPGEAAGNHVREGQGHRDQPRPDVEVNRVERGRVDPDEHLPRSPRGLWQVTALDDLGGTGLFDVGGAHRVCLNPVVADRGQRPGDPVIHYRRQRVSGQWSVVRSQTNV